jgi:3-methylcrotonyl-CoA carboxylase alpha subunit
MSLIRSADRVRRIRICVAMRSSKSRARRARRRFIQATDSCPKNADFAESVERAGIAFVGPSADSMRKMGSKAGAKDLMAGHGVPVVPGYTGADQDPALLAREAQRIGFPLMIKAAHGGGGKGMRIVRGANEFAADLESCQREAKNAFRARPRAARALYRRRRATSSSRSSATATAIVVHLERARSARRSVRYQKVLEETPVAFLTPEPAHAHGRRRGSRRAARSTMSTRARSNSSWARLRFLLHGNQHTLAGRASGHRDGAASDLVELQLRVAAGEALPASLIQKPSPSRGGLGGDWCFSPRRWPTRSRLRLYAEDPQQGFLPGSGRLERLRLPTPNEHVRIDAGVIEGDTVTIFYDPMIAKLIVWDRTRDAALQRMREALAQCDVVGPKSNIDFLERLVRHPAVIEGRIDTGYLDRHLDQFLDHGKDADPVALFAAASAWLLHEESGATRVAAASGDPHSPWARADGWRLGHAGKRIIILDHVSASKSTRSARAATIAWQRRASASLRGAARRRLLSASSTACQALSRARRPSAIVSADGDRPQCVSSAPAFRVRRIGTADGATGRRADAGAHRADQGESRRRVDEGEELLVMEAMKMELTLRAPHARRSHRCSAAPAIRRSRRGAQCVSGRQMKTPRD